MPVYLDYNATAPLMPQAREAMQAALGQPHNASSIHSFGREAKKLLEDARTRVAASISAFPNEVIFCASGTEANNWALTAFPERRVIVSAIEHPSVLQVSGAKCKVLEDGIVDLAALDAMLTDSKPALVSLMLANNETGVIQPIPEVAAICKKHGALLHCDAAQALGRVPVDFSSLRPDMMTITAHKCGGPVGAAALIVKTGLEIPSMLRGGRQESGRRAGTENIAAIVGFAAACEADFSHAPLRGWLDDMESELEKYGATVMGKNSPRLPNTSCISMPNASNEVQLMHFDLAGIAVSAGSACSSGRIGPSHVLEAIKVPESEAASAIRVSGGWGTTQAHIQAFTEGWKTLYFRISAPAKRA